ncbi:MAG: Ig-like domain-containing protein, partial [Candidatus Omnitrophica bacterium]|nr:Ig-like domain-containing protein [Candidatus Omnitrophota bacterium]
MKTSFFAMASGLALLLAAQTASAAAMMDYLGAGTASAPAAISDADPAALSTSLPSPANGAVYLAPTNELPVVTVMATDPSASEVGQDTGTFQVTRTGSTNDELTVYYLLGGTATNSVDYEMLPGYVSIPAGTTTADITVTPKLDADQQLHTNDTVLLQLHPAVEIDATLPELYTIGWPSNAVVTIEESVPPATNVPPVVRMVHPEDGAGYTAPARIVLVAQAKDPDGTVTNVEFFAGDTSLGVGRLMAWDDEDTQAEPGFAPAWNILGGDHYIFVWTNVPAGEYVLTAKATDDLGETTGSDPVTIHVVEPAQLPVVTVVASDPDPP